MVDPRKRKAFVPLAVILSVVAFLCAVFLVGKWLESRNLKQENKGNLNDRYAYEKTIEYNGVTYRPKSNLTTLLVIGVDKTEDDPPPISSRSGGQADFLRLLILDGRNHTIGQLPIDRDTIANVVTLGVLGNRSGTRKMQISLSHSFGDGGEESCELTAEAVSNLLSGVTISNYLAMNLDGIEAFNTVLGGVTVTIEDDLSVLDPALVPGAKVKLQGSQAELFVRSRMSVGDGTNASRMKRQHEYVSQAMELISQKLRSDPDYIGEIYDAVQPYLTCNISRTRLVRESYAARDYVVLPAYSIQGTHRVAEDGFMEFHPDEDALIQLVLQLFYEKIENL